MDARGGRIRYRRYKTSQQLAARFSRQASGDLSLNGQFCDGFRRILFCLPMLWPSSSTKFSDRRRHARGRRLGFTLIEVLMVVAVLAIIAGVVLPEVNSAVDDARNAAVLKDLHEFTFAIERYRADHNGA